MCLYSYLKYKDPGVCRPRSWIKVFQPLGCCTVNERSYCYIGNIRSDNYSSDNLVTYTHNNCVCNAYLALTLRHQAKTPPLNLTFLPLFLDALFGLFNDHKENIVVNNLLARQQVVNGYKGRWFRRYDKALNDLKKRSLDRKDFHNDCFIKADKENGIRKAARLIQYMKATGALEMGRFTHAVEGNIYACKD